jgi:hypothetical protein
MIKVQFPEPSFQVRKKENSAHVFDSIRKKWLLLTEEEWVRQNIIQYLVHTLKYPSTSLAIEKEIRLNELKKRFDIVVYDSNIRPWMMIECKAPSIELNESVLQQVLRYNMSVPVQYIIITNGTNTMGWQKNVDSLVQIQNFPEW